MGKVNKLVVVLISIFITIVVVGLFYSCILLIPEVENIDKKLINIGGKAYRKESIILVLVLLTGAMGSFVHLLSSFVKYVGTRKFENNWILWYLLRPLIGMSLALIFYFAFRGGMMTPTADVSQINIYGVLTISCLAGMFSKQATEKLNEVFSTVFSAKETKSNKE